MCVQVTSRMKRVSNCYSEERNTGYYLETLRLGLRLYRGLFANSLGVRAPLFCGHKLTYNCNLRCKMCPFWKKSSTDPSLEKEKAILKQIHDSDVFGVAFEGGEPLLRNDLVNILAFSRSLPLHTSLVTNGTLLESRIDEIAPYINGVIYVSLDGLKKTHDTIRGVNGCFKKAIEGIIASKEKVSVTINTTIMTENLHEIEDMVKLAKELHTGISVAIAHEYCNTNVSAPTANETAKIARKLIEMKKKGYPLANSVNYFRVMAKEKNWKCRPWATINVDPKGDLVLPCYVGNEYATSVSILETDIKTAISGFSWKEIRNCEKCVLHCYVEPSLVLSSDFLTNLNWIFRIRI
jgi:radical SAM family uncharacterized protein